MRINGLHNVVSGPAAELLDVVARNAQIVERGRKRMTELMEGDVIAGFFHGKCDYIAYAEMRASFSSSITICYSVFI